VRWLTLLWRELVRDVILTLGGLGTIGTQVTALHPNPYLIGAGLALTAPATYQKLKELGAASGTGGSGPLSSPPGQEPPGFSPGQEAGK
jgi:hypothetical protein